LISIAQSSGIISQGVANGIKISTRKWSKEFCDDLWRSYKSNGRITLDTDDTSNDSEQSTIILTMPDGSQKKWVFLDQQQMNRKDYVALSDLSYLDYEVYYYDIEKLKLELIVDDYEMKAIRAIFDNHFQNNVSFEYHVAISQP
jgi:hypothetical protein